MNTKIETVEQLHEHLGMAPDQLIRNGNGEIADILSINTDGTVRLGIIATGEQINVPLENFYKQNPYPTSELPMG